MKAWTEHLKPEDLPGFLVDIARIIGVEATLKLSESLGGGTIYLPQATGIVNSAKRKYITENADKKIFELRVATGYSDRQIIRILKEITDSDEKKQIPLI